MPGAVAVRPKDGQVFVASMKTGELFALRDPAGDGKKARFENYGRGLFQDALSMLAEDDALVRPAPPEPHRRSPTTATAWPIASTASPPCRTASPTPTTWPTAWPATRAARFVFSYAPYANTTMPGCRRRPCG